MKILKAGVSCFLSRGYAMTTMDAIAAKARLSKRTLYTRFSSKSALFEEVVHHVLEANLHLLSNDRSTVGAFREQLMAFAERLLFVALAPDVIALERIVTGEAKQFPQLAARLHQRYREQIVQWLCELMARSGLETSNVQPRQDAEIFLAMVVLPRIRQAVLYQSKPGYNAADRTAIARSVEIFAKGVVT